VAETRAVIIYRKSLIERLKHRRSDIRSGSQRPVDQNGTVIMQSEDYPSNTVSVLATRGANGELTRMINMLESERE